MSLFEIAVAAPLEQALTYKLPDNLLGDAPTLIGRRVLVPLGRRKVTGYVLSEVSHVSGDFTIKNISEVLDAQPLFPQGIIPLFRWIANYYHYPLGEVIKTALPAGLAPKSIVFLELTESGREILAAEQGLFPEKYVNTLLETGKLSATVTRQLLCSPVKKKHIERLIKEGSLLRQSSVTTDNVKAKLETCYLPSQQLAPLPETINGSEEQDDIVSYQTHLKFHAGLSLKLSEAKTLYYIQKVERITQDRVVPRKELLGLYAGAARAVRPLIERGLVKEEQHRVFRSPLGEQLEFVPAPQKLTDEQENVLAEILPAIEKGGFAPFLLHGVTGSGKTEVYLQAAAATLEQGRTVLVIVPEIALATQLEAHFVSRFGDKVVLLHSGLSAVEKFDQWSLALSGEGRVVIGARSAIFAPLENPGLIVVDEEHDQGLKQDDGLRYHGRDLAMVRGKQQGAVVLLSSATPSVVSYHNSITGKYRLLTMEKRVAGRALPKVNIIDLRQTIPGKKRSLFRPPLEEALKKNLECGFQSVIFINRRGFSANVICQECGTPVQCKDCNVSLTLHKSRQRLLCHYCGYSVHEKTVCETCGSLSLVPIGFGTERVEEELRVMLPQARIARLDTDTSRDRQKFLETLKEMRDGAIDILVGTQMVAKGHHFPGVTVVGVVWADGGLCIPDFRAAEKTFQLITQVTGRAGRGVNPGEVFIQTMRPDHYAIAYARNHSYRQLVEKELELRKNPQFPPYVRIVAIHLQGEIEQDVERCASRVADACRAAVAAGRNPIEILGPAPSPIDRVKKNYRWQILVKAPSTDMLDSLCSYLLSHKQEFVTNRCRMFIDKDPENMM